MVFRVDGCRVDLELRVSGVGLRSSYFVLQVRLLLSPDKQPPVLQRAAYWDASVYPWPGRRIIGQK